MLKCTSGFLEQIALFKATNNRRENNFLLMYTIKLIIFLATLIDSNIQENSLTSTFKRI